MNQKQYSVLNVTEDTREKIDSWQKALEKRYDRRVTMDEVIDYLTDMAGVPEEMQ